MIQPERTYSFGGEYRYGFNGKENDNEVKGRGNQIDYDKRIYDSRIGRFNSIDPEFNRYPSITPYHMSMNNPIYFKDIDGRVLTDPNGNIIYEVDKNFKPSTSTYGNYSVTVQAVYVFSNKNEKILVQRYTVIDKKSGKQVSNIAIKEAYNCHGHSALKDKFRVNSSKNESNALLLDKAGLNQTDDLESKINKDLTKLKPGDIVALFNTKGVVVHSFIYKGNNQVSSKNGELGINEFPDIKGGTTIKSNATVSDVVSLYNAVEKGGVKAGFFTPVKDKIVFTDIDMNATYTTPVDGTIKKTEISPPLLRAVPDASRVEKPKTN